MSKQTALFELHKTLNANLVDFAGWQLPLHYGSTLDEHHAVRKHAGFFDVSHMTTVDLKGAQVKDFLQHLLANDIAKISVNKALYTCMLNQDGGILDDLICYYISDSHFRVVVNAATTDSDVAWIEQHARDYAVDVKARHDLSMIAIQGPKARELTQPLLPKQMSDSVAALKPFSFTVDEDADVFVARTGYTGEDGFEVVLPHQEAVALAQALVKANVQPCGLGARDTLRLEAGLNLYGTDMNDTVSPYESNLGWTVDLKNEAREFIGKQALLKQKESGVKQRLVAIVLRDKGILRNKQNVRLPSGEEGIVTSGGFAPSLDCSVGFARIPKTDATELEVLVRKNWLGCNIVKAPFIKQGQKTF